MQGLALKSRLAVASMTLGVMLLISIEFMPAVLLSPIESSLGATEGMTGQAVSISGIFAIATSLLLTTIIGNIDRKWVLVSTTIAFIISVALLASAESLRTVIIARAFIGVSAGGFWSLAAATLMRIVPEHQLPQAMTVMYMGQAIAATFSAPLGSLLAQSIG